MNSVQATSLFVKRRHAYHGATFVIRVLASLALFMICAAGLRAQETQSGGGEGSGGGAFYDFSTGKGFSMDVNVWGAVNKPGIYRVPASTRLVQIISFAGGPAPQANLVETKVVHDLRVDSTILVPLQTFNLEQFQLTADTSLNPILYPYDTVIIPVKPDTFSSVLGVVRDVGLILVSIVSLYATIKGL